MELFSGIEMMIISVFMEDGWCKRSSLSQWMAKYSGLEDIVSRVVIKIFL